METRHIHENHNTKQPNSLEGLCWNQTGIILTRASVLGRFLKWMGIGAGCTTYSHGWKFFTKISIGQNHPRWWSLTNKINSIPSKNYSLQTKKSRKKARFHLSFFLSQKPSIAYKTSNISRPCFFSGYSLKEKHKIPISIGKKNICRTCFFLGLPHWHHHVHSICLAELSFNPIWKNKRKSNWIISLSIWGKTYKNLWRKNTSMGMCMMSAMITVVMMMRRRSRDGSVMCLFSSSLIGLGIPFWKVFSPKFTVSRTTSALISRWKQEVISKRTRCVYIYICMCIYIYMCPCTYYDIYIHIRIYICISQFTSHFQQWSSNWQACPMFENKALFHNAMMSWRVSNNASGQAHIQHPIAHVGTCAGLHTHLQLKSTHHGTNKSLTEADGCSKRAIMNTLWYTSMAM